jgi:hypothetical protein
METPKAWTHIHAMTIQPIGIQIKPQDLALRNGMSLGLVPCRLRIMGSVPANAIVTQVLYMAA